MAHGKAQLGVSIGYAVVGNSRVFRVLCGDTEKHRRDEFVIADRNFSSQVWDKPARCTRQQNQLGAAHVGFSAEAIKNKANLFEEITGRQRC